MSTIQKRSYEEIFYTHQFRRTDGNGWLGSSEKLSECAVAVLDSDGSEQASMVSDAEVASDTYVKYKLKAGTDGETYTVRIRGVSSDGNKFEDRVTLAVSDT